MKCKLLIVDDEKKMVKYLSKRLVIRGYDVRTAFSGQEALAAIKKNQFDVVLLDIMMPGMDGIETLKEIKTIAPTTAVILLTGHASAKLDAEGRKWGAFDYILKPFDLNNLIEKIHLADRHRCRKHDSVKASGAANAADHSD
jgi:DNA-binding response OmpR family regulator